jgi:hypothetical protein
VGEDRIADQIGAALRAGEVPSVALIEPRLRAPVAAEPARLAAFVPELTSYDTLIAEVAS